MAEKTIESFKETLDILIDANPHARNKGDEFKTWCTENFGCDARISYVKEQRQITNRVSEQFRYFAPIVVFVCVSEVKRDTLMRYILERVYKQLEAVAIIGVTTTGTEKRYTFEQLITFKQTEFSDWASPNFANVKEASILAEELGVTIDPLDQFGVEFAWYVGTTGNDENGKWKDFSDEYIDQGIWENGWDDKFVDVVDSIKVGDRIVIKSSFTQKYNLPFDNHGKMVGAMRLKAIGTVTGNDHDGKRITVDWTRLDPAKTWYGPGTLRETIHSVNANDGYVKKMLLDFTFSDVEQDYSLCEERYAEDVDETSMGDGEGLEPVPTLVDSIDESKRRKGGSNVLLYGVPGSGKSWTIEHEYCRPGSVVERLVFHPDYTNADFIGQILPVVDSDKQVTYEFTPGPFTVILKEAYTHPEGEYILIIEEVNRGNAPAIFGEVFQLLDRSVIDNVKEGYPAGTSEYGITHSNIANYVYEDSAHKVRIPSNLSIIGTMNTSDQNVFTLDTAFQRRWRMRLIENNFDNVRSSLANAEILDTGVTWQQFCNTVNGIIIGNKAKMASAEDKRLGVYFIHENDVLFDQRTLPSEGFVSLLVEYNSLLKDERLNEITEEKTARLFEIRDAVMHNRLFPEKVIKYLWDDAFKFNPEALFDTENMDSLEKVIRTFVYSTGADRFRIFKQTIRDLLYPAQQQ